MKKSTLTLIIPAICAAFLGVFALAHPSAAVDPPAQGQIGAGQGLQISPAVMSNLRLNPGENRTIQIKLSNVSSAILIATPEINDFTASGEDGVPKILIDKNSEEAQDNPRSFAKFVGPIASYTIKPKQIVTVPINITIPRSASPGGYYGVIRFTARPADIDTTGVSLSASVGSLVLLQVNGDLQEQLSVASFTTEQGGKASSIFETTPIDFVVRIKNEGNIHGAPVGQVTVKDMFGNVIGTPNINLEQRDILPDTIRKFSETLDRRIIGDRFLIGLYTADLKLTYGNDGNKTIKQSLSFWVIPYTLIGLILIALIVMFFVIRSSLKRYKRRIIRQTQRRSRRR